MEQRWRFSALWRVDFWLQDEPREHARHALLGALLSLLDDPRSAPSQQTGFVDRHEAFVRDVPEARVRVTYLLWEHSDVIRILRIDDTNG